MGYHGAGGEMSWLKKLFGLEPPTPQDEARAVEVEVLNGIRVKSAYPCQINAFAARMLLRERGFNATVVPQRVEVNGEFIGDHACVKWEKAGQTGYILMDDRGEFYNFKESEPT